MTKPDTLPRTRIQLVKMPRLIGMGVSPRIGKAKSQTQLEARCCYSVSRKLMLYESDYDYVFLLCVLGVSCAVGSVLRISVTKQHVNQKGATR